MVKVDQMPLGPGAGASLVLVVSDLNLSLAYWVEVFGAKTARADATASDRVDLWIAGIRICLATGVTGAADLGEPIFTSNGDGRDTCALAIRVVDCWGCYGALTARGASFLGPPHERGDEVVCVLRDPDGHLIEISQLVLRLFAPADGGRGADS